MLLVTTSPVKYVTPIDGGVASAIAHAPLADAHKRFSINDAFCEAVCEDVH